MGERVLSEPPDLLRLYGKAALGAIPFADRVPWLGVGGRSPETPDTTLLVPELRVERERLARYCRVCGFTLRNEVPPTYPHLLGFPLQMSLITEEDFPFSGVGLVHIANEIVQHRPIGLGEPLELRVRAGNLAPHPKGRRFEFLTEVRVGSELVWESVSPTLSRGAGADPEAVERAPGFEAADFGELPGVAEWRLDAGLGRRYAAVSGDRNPIHISEWTAKPFGFPKAIAHGMWTKARSLAALEGELPEALRVAVRFKRPVLLPGRVTFASSADGAGGARFAVRDARRGTPHLEGLLEAR